MSFSPQNFSFSKNKHNSKNVSDVEKKKTKKRTFINVWLHSSVDGSAQIISGRPGFESRRSLNFFPASFLQLFNPLALKSDQHLISPNNINLESNIKVMRIKETITN